MAVRDDEVTGRIVADRDEASRAVMLRREDLNQLVLQLTGVSARPRRTFGELAEAWLRRIAPLRVCPENERRHVQHLRPLAELREGELTKTGIDELFGQLLAPTGHLSAASVNKLRSTGRLIIRDAQGDGEWQGPNPFELVRRFRVPKRLYLTLTLPEIRQLLPKLRPDRRRMVRAGILVGLRPGEALGMLKVDVDLVGKMMRVRRSHGRPQTKTGKEREFPIPDELLEDLRAAMALSPTEYVFPAMDGSRQRADTKLARMLRVALGAAGVVEGYRHRCRNKACPWEELRPAVGEPADCPSCGFRVRVSAVPRPLRFYDLRHTCATVHRKAGCDPLVIQELLGHASNLTDGTYTHLDEDYRRFELNKLKLE